MRRSLISLVVTALLFVTVAASSAFARDARLTWKYNLVENSDVVSFEVQVDSAATPLVIQKDEAQTSGSPDNTTFTYTVSCDDHPALCQTAPTTYSIVAVDQAGHKSDPTTVNVDLAPYKVRDLTITIIEQ